MFLHFLQTKEHKEAFLELAHLVANADGFVNRKERGYLRSIMDEMELQQSGYAFSSERELKDIVGGIQDDAIKNIFFIEILLLIFADGDYNDDEKQIVMDIKRLFGYTDDIYEAFKGWVIRMDKLKIEGTNLILDPSSQLQH
ncbi:TerB family tellurite resistance protein [Paenibacillus sp. sgz302251]|uniref:TerB family tellurite resistance protein n=1 Tax=Paenibacillus sp. sgz302251 TaxID=3414493 RepID=UPI003C7D49BC